MRRLAITLAMAALLSALVGVSPAAASFGLNGFDVGFTSGPDGSVATQAGSHPFAMRTTFNLNTREDPLFGTIPDGDAKNIEFSQIAGFIGDPYATPRCSTLDFLRTVPAEERPSDCPNSTAVGVVAARVIAPSPDKFAPVFNLVPPPGVAAKLGFVVVNTPVTVEIRIQESFPYNVVAKLSNTPQTVPFYGAELTLWGNPADEVHDPYRGSCLDLNAGEELKSKGECSAGVANRPFLTMPPSCLGPLRSSYVASSWQDPAGLIPGESVSAVTTSGCDKLGFVAQLAGQPTNPSAESPTGFDFNLDVQNEGLTSSTGTANSNIEKTVVTLPKGVTINPSQAEGLGVCTPAQYARERSGSQFGEGCPGSSKIGTVRADTPLLDESQPLEGNLFVAEPDDPTTGEPGAENPFNSLIAVYMVIKNPRLGLMVKLAGEVVPDPRTGQLVATFDRIPQLPVSHFKVRFREGARSPLVTPPTCGDYAIKTEFTPWANPAKIATSNSSFHIGSGPNGGPCPSGGVPPFHPGFEAGSISNNAGSYSPFYLRLTRKDGEQDMTRFDSVLPPGVVGKIAGVSRCPDSAAAVAKQNTGRQELAHPSCPASSQIGRTLAGAGVGSALTYVPGKLYLGGPFAGDPLSVIAITPAVAGPFDVGTVVVRQALTLDPETAEVQVDGAHSDPIPHILRGIPLKLRDLRVYVDRGDFTLNPTSCEPEATRATLFGGFLDAFSSADDAPVSVRAPYQAANCANLAFRPKLSLKLKGGTRRGDHPALRSIVDYPPGAGYANIGKAVVTLPHSAFLEQAHIRTVCTRVQFAAQQCPAGSIYGHAKAITPLLDEPLQGPVYLRSSSHRLPDLVFALHGLVDVNVVARIDSIQGRIRATLDSVPDTPVSKFILDMQGGKKGLVVNSRNLCRHRSKARVDLTGQNGRTYDTTPVVKVKCARKNKRSGRASAHRRR